MSFFDDHCDYGCIIPHTISFVWLLLSRIDLGEGMARLGSTLALDIYIEYPHYQATIHYSTLKYRCRLLLSLHNRHSRHLRESLERYPGHTVVDGSVILGRRLLELRTSYGKEKIRASRKILYRVRRRQRHYLLLQNVVL
jgi:hypothetical protein